MMDNGMLIDKAEGLESILLLYYLCVKMLVADLENKLNGFGDVLFV